VLSGAERSARQDQALHSAEELLVRERERLVLLLDPPFEGARRDPGYIKAYPPGVRENGGQYTHAAAWLGWAHGRAGNGARAERIFRLLNPVLRTQAAPDVERYRVEPYVLAADIYSGSDFSGRGGWTWYTGAAAWTWRLGVEAILGLYREAGGYRFDPCIPPQWQKFDATLRVGESEIHVEVTNPDGIGRGVIGLSLDGKDLDPRRVVELDSTRSGRRHVRVVLGNDGAQASRTRERKANPVDERRMGPGETS
jgi:cyclic beta-1,2-glucan synthetase